MESWSEGASSTAFERLADVAPARTRRDATRITVILVLSLLATTLLVYFTGGTHQAFLHTIYLPIIIASLSLGLSGGVITAVTGGLVVLGPLMPLSVSSGIEQSWPSVAFRMAILILVAIITGGFGEGLRRRREHLEASKARIQELHSRNLRMFARLVSERDQETAGHCERVAHNCVVVGRKLGLPADELRLLYWSGMLHDLGKISVPEAILQKRGRLTPDEFTIIKQHAVHGAEFILAISEEFGRLAAAVRSHHEKWDGSGYPDGLKGPAIPLAARILAVVDVFEAVTSVRPYRNPMDLDEACDLIRAGAGTHFDPEIVKAFLAEEREGRIIHHDEPEPLYDRFVMEIARDPKNRIGSAARK
jgi:hypothetical protein